MTELPRYCVECGVDFQGEKILEEERWMYDEGDEYYSRILGQYDWDKDRTVAWACPDCGHTTERK